MRKYQGKYMRFPTKGPGPSSIDAKAANRTHRLKNAVASKIKELFARVSVFFAGLVSKVTSTLPRRPLGRTLDAGSRAVSGRGNARRYAMTAYTLPGILDRALGRIVDTAIALAKAIVRSKPALIGLGAGIGIAFVVIIAVDFSRVRALATFTPSVTTTIYDKNDVLIAELFTEKREIVPLRRIPKDLIHAVIAIEDNEFYDHWGINPKGIVRAFFINLFSGRIRQGGSTITQQLAKVLLTSGERTIFRKAKEAVIAVMMEFTYTKNEILALYLNQIFFGHGTYGVEAASKLYFGKHVWELTLAESALLATLPTAPNQYSPIRHPKRSMQRHRIVLAKMVEMGYITVPQAERAYLDFWPSYLDYLSGIPPTMTTASVRENKAPWFTEYVRRELVKKYGAEMVYEKGLRVYTTLDVNKQIAAQEVLKKALDRQTAVSAKLAFRNEDLIVEQYGDMVELFTCLFDIPRFRKRGSRQIEKLNTFIRNEIVEELDGLNALAGIENVSAFLDRYRETYLEDRTLQKVEGCLISINQTNGFIEAMVGGSEFTSINQLNRAVQSRRQPGSSVKPIIYAAAIESGKFTPATTVMDSPMILPDGEGGDWIPENYEGDFSGFVRLRKALALSINVVSVRIAQEIGIDAVIKYMGRLLRLKPAEAKERIPRNFSVALGSVEVSPLELTTAYAIIANGGKDVIPFAIRRVVDRDGNVLENREEEVRKILEREEKDGSIQVIKPETAQVLISMLQSVITDGTGRGASPGRPAAGKTGTTNSWKDAWFVGFTPQLATGIWIGYDKMGLSLGIGQAGGAVAAPVWGEYVRRALKDEPALDFPAYAPLVSIRVCEKSGLLPSPECRDTIEEVFVPGVVPEHHCDICAGAVTGSPLPKTTPHEDIIRQQKQTINRHLEKKKKESIIDHIDEDMIE